MFAAASVRVTVMSLLTIDRSKGASVNRVLSSHPTS